jgi:hypothetical protein
MPFNDWNFSNDHVEEGYSGGQFASAETTLVAAGPPRLSQASGGAGASGMVYPIGLLENIGISQSKQLQRIFEIGSSRSYFIPGRVMGSISLGRVFYYGPSLLRVLYAYYKNDTDGVEIGTNSFGSLIDQGSPNARKDPNASLIDLNDISAASTHNVQQSPGDDYFFINLASDMFNQATGLAVYFKDSNNNLIGAMYLEDCFVQGHQMSVSSGSVLIMEGATMQFDRALPIRVTA